MIVPPTAAIPPRTDETHDLAATVDTSKAQADTQPRLSVTPEPPGRYRSDNQPARELGRGGLGRVFIAFDEHLQREVAVKELLAGTSVGRGALDTPVGFTSVMAARFLREARVTAGLEHPSIIPVYEVGERPDGTLYYTMKLVRGRTLAHALRECRTITDRLRLLGHFEDMCQAMAYAHTRGVIHRDLKPLNVMVGEFGETVLLDWGLARLRGQKDQRRDDLARDVQQLSDAARTVDGTILGTPAYMSPEQAAGRVDEIDERSDVWSLGAVLYEILTGRPPFQATSSHDLIVKVLQERVRAVREVCADAPAELAAVCAKALERDPGRRYRTARELADELEAFETGRRVAAHDYSAMELLRRFVARHRAAVSVGVAAAVVLLAVGLASYRRVVQEQRRVSRALADSDYREALRLLEHDEGRRALAHLGRAARLDPQQTGIRSLLVDRLLRQPRMVPSAELASGGVPTDVRFSADGKTVATLDGEGVRVWEAASGRLLAGPIGPKNAVSFDYSAEAGRVATGSWFGTGQVWDVRSGNAVGAALPHWDYVLQGWLGPNGKVLVTTSTTMTHVWDVASGRALGDAHPGYAKVAFAKGNQLVIASASALEVVAPDGTSRQGHILDQRTRWNVALLEVSADATRAITRDRGSVARLWDVGAGRVIRVAENVTSAHLATGGGYAVVQIRGTTEVWDAVSGNTLGTVEEFFEILGFAPDANTVLARSSFGLGRLTVVDVAARRPVGPAMDVPSSGTGLTSARLLADGRVLSVAGRRAQLWDASTGRVLAPPAVHDESIDSVEVSPDGSRLVTVGGRRARLWDAKTMKPVGAPLEHERAVAMAVFSPDGRRLLTVGGDHKAQVWDAQSGVAIGEPLLHSSPVVAGEFSADGSVFATTTFDDVTVWKADTRARVAGPFRNEARVQSVRFTPDGKRLLTAAASFAQVWEADTGRRIGEVMGHDAAVETVHISGDGRKVLTTARGASVWDIASGREEAVFPHESTSRENDRTRSRFSSDGRHAVVVDRTKVHAAIRVWDVATGAVLGDGEAGNTCDEVRIGPGAQRILCVAKDTPSVDVLERISTSESSASGPTSKWISIRTPLARHPEISTAELSADGSRVVLDMLRSDRGSDRLVRIQDVDADQDLVEPLATEGGFWLGPDGTIATPTLKVVRLWHGPRAPAAPTTIEHGAKVNEVAFSPDGRLLATAGEDGVVRMWNADTGQPSGAPLPHGAPLVNVVFSSDGRRMLTASAAKEARLWNTETWQLVGPPRSPVTSAELSPDGTRLLTAYDPDTPHREFRLWDAASGAPLPLTVENSVRAISFGPGNQLVTVSPEGIAIRDAQGARSVASLPGRYFSPQLSVDARQLFAWSFDRQLVRWDVTTGDVTRIHVNGFPVGWSLGTNRVVMTDANSPPRIIDLGRLQPTAQLAANDPISWAMLSPDGVRLATGASANSRTRLQLWDADTGRAASLPLGFPDVIALRFTADGHRLAAAAATGTVFILDVPAASDGDADRLARLAEVNSGYDLTNIDAGWPTLSDTAERLRRLAQEVTATSSESTEDHKLLRWLLSEGDSRPHSPFSAVSRSDYSGRHVIRVPAAGGVGSGPLHLRLRDVDITQAFAGLHQLDPSVGFVVDADVRGRVTVEMRGTTLEEALAALTAWGCRISPRASLRRVTSGADPVLSPAATTSGQGEGLSLWITQLPLREFLNILQDLSGIRSLIPRDGSILQTRLTLYASDIPWDQAVEATFQSAGLTYRILKEPDRILVALQSQRRLLDSPDAFMPLPAADEKPYETPTVDTFALGGVGWGGAKPGFIAFARSPDARSPDHVRAFSPGESLDLTGGRVVAIGPTSVELERPGSADKVIVRLPLLQE